MSFISKLFGRRKQSELEEDVPETAPATEVPILVVPAKQVQAPSPNQLPSFKISAMGRTSVSMEAENIVAARLRLRDVFTPAQPVTDSRYFAGRLEVLANLIEVIEERLSHVVVFGERGIGKTSLMHILTGLARESRYLVVRATCGSSTRFDEMFRKLVADIPLFYLKTISPTDPRAEEGASLASMLPEGHFDARELSELLGQIAGTRILIILDEYDRLENEDVRQQIAELIKNLSDQAAPVQLVIAGVSGNLHELIGYIPSIRRNIVGIPMPRLTTAEVGRIIEIGENHAKVEFDNKLTPLIYALSNGSPYMTRLICHHASGIALDEGRTKIATQDVENGLQRMVEEAESRLSFQTARRVKKLQIEKNRELVGQIARIAATPDGWFSQSDINAYADKPAQANAMLQLVDKTLLAAKLIEREAGDGEGDVRYRFVDEGLPNYLWMMVARNQFKGGKE